MSSFLISEACINVSEIMNFYPNSSLSLVLIKSILASTLFLDKLLSLNSFRILFIISFLVSYEPCIRKISAFNNSWLFSSNISGFGYSIFNIVKGNLLKPIVYILKFYWKC